MELCFHHPHQDAQFESLEWYCQLFLKRNGYKRASICFCVSEKLGCEITGEEYCGEKEDALEDEISRALLSALIGEVQFVNNAEGEVQSIVFEG